MKKFFLALVLLSNACSTNFEHKLSYEPQTRLRVAVLPLVKVSEVGEVIETEEGRLLIDNLSLNQSSPIETPTQIVRRILVSTLQNTNFNLVSQDLIDVDLPHHGFSSPGNKIDYNKLYSTSAKYLCESFLDCDAVLYGKLIRFERSYFGVESVHEVALELKLVSAKDEKILYYAKASDYETRGLTKGPTGFSSIVIEPIQGLDLKITENLTRNLVQQMIEPLVIEKAKVSGGEIVVPPAIFAAAYHSTNSKVTSQDPLSILVMGSSAAKVKATIDNTGIDIPLIERSPGHYTGKYFPIEGDQITSDKINITVRKSGVVTESSILGDKFEVK